MSSVTHTETKTAPVKATWITLVLAWVLFLIPIPGLGLFVGWTLNLVAFILAIVVMVRGRTAGGLIPLLGSVMVSPLVYFIGLAIFGVAVGGSSYKDYVERAQAQAEASTSAAAAADAKAADPAATTPAATEAPAAEGASSK